VNSIFVKQTCCVLNNFSYSIAMRFAWGQRTKTQTNLN